jgi:hypothetical protein
MKPFSVVVLGLGLLLTCCSNPFLHLRPPVAIAPNRADLLELHTATIGLILGGPQGLGSNTDQGYWESRQKIF